MIYQTIEAYVENGVVVLPNPISTSQKRTKILITFLGADDKDGLLSQLPEDMVTEELRDLSNKALAKDKKSFSNI